MVSSVRSCGRQEPFEPEKPVPCSTSVHALDRAEAREAQRERLTAAFAELVAERGLAAVTVTDVVGHAAVSREAFYSCFDDLAGCADAAYERFISVLIEHLGAAMDPTEPWQPFVESAVRAYLETLQDDPVVARAMQIEMDAAGKPARLRRRRALNDDVALTASLRNPMLCRCLAVCASSLSSTSGPR